MRAVLGLALILRESGSRGQFLTCKMSTVRGGIPLRGSNLHAELLSYAFRRTERQHVATFRDIAFFSPRNIASILARSPDC